MAVIVLFPCSQFEHLTSGRTESEAQEIIETWIAVHHPALLEQENAVPRWETASYPPFNLQQDIVVVPPCCESYWNDDWEKQTAECTVIRNIVPRNEIVQQILASKNYQGEPFAEDFINDCYAFAAARFVLAMLNRNSYYMSSPDDNRLKELMRCAVERARCNEPSGVKQALQSAFDEVASAKDNYHPTQNYFIELTLITETTVGEPLRQLLRDAGQINLFMSSKVLATLPETQPETFAQLKSAVEQNKVRFVVDDSVVDDSTDEPKPMMLLPMLDVADRILAGLSVYRELLNVSPTVFGRLDIGLTPTMPQLLKLTEMKGAIHFAPMAGWQTKEKEQSKIVWQGTDNTSVDTLLRYPIDASKYLGFFELAEQYAAQLNQDTVPTSVFALFPGQRSDWLDILRRINRYTTALGEFVDIEKYFASTTYSGGMQQFGYEKYPIQALMKSGKNPISRWNELYQASRERLVQSALETLLTLLGHPIEERAIAQQFAEAVSLSGDKTAGSLCVNPFSFPRRMFHGETAVDVPPMGYTFVEKTTQAGMERSAMTDNLAGTPGTPLFRFAPFRLLSKVNAKNKPDPLLARQAADDIGRGEKRTVYILENRYFSAKFDETTGMLRSLFTNRSRFNQLSQQVACRKNQIYTVQCVDEITITKSTPDAGQLHIAGRLVFPEGEVAARFSETVKIRSQSRVLEFNLTLEPLMEWDDDRWNSYIAVRYAWDDDTFTLRGNLNDTLHVLPDRMRLHSPMLLDLRHDTASLSLFSEGLPFHRRSDARQLDTLLMVKGETHPQFRWGIGVNMKNPMCAAHNFALKQKEYVFPANNAPKIPSAWLFQIEANNVIALHWEPVYEEEKCVGYWVYLQEIEGRRGHFPLRSFVKPVKASAMNFMGKEIKTFKTQDDAVLIDMHVYELLPLLVRTV